MAVPNGLAPQMIDVAVVGGGPAGLVAAVGFARAGRSVALFAPPRPADRRATALLGRSIDFLEDLGIWPALAAKAEPLRTIRIVDASRRLIRAPEVTFEADELGLDAFGFSVANSDLLTALDTAVAGTGISRIDAAAQDIALGRDGVLLGAPGGDSVSARLVVGADGRRSPSRAAAGIGVRSRNYPQVALSATIRHERPHHGISTEFHGESGPFTLVPLTGLSVSLVWVERPDEAERLLRLPAAEVEAEIERRAHFILGRCRLETRLQGFPLSTMAAERYSSRRVALVGEAAHVMPPIGAQGFNLALADIEALLAATRGNPDPGDPRPLSEYDGKRRAEVRLRAGAVDILNRSLLSDLLPVQALRGLGLFALGALPPLRRALMRQSLGV